jgi:hypothetical protein
MKKFALALVPLMFLAAACQSAGPAAEAPPPQDPAAVAAAQVAQGAAGAEKVGGGSKPGFCTFKSATGALIEKKC